MICKPCKPSSLRTCQKSSKTFHHHIIMNHHEPSIFVGVPAKFWPTAIWWRQMWRCFLMFPPGSPDNNAKMAQKKSQGRNRHLENRIQQIHGDPWRSMVPFKLGAMLQSLCPWTGRLWDLSDNWKVCKISISFDIYSISGYIWNMFFLKWSLSPNTMTTGTALEMWVLKVHKKISGVSNWVPRLEDGQHIKPAVAVPKRRANGRKWTANGWISSNLSCLT